MPIHRSRAFGLDIDDHIERRKRSLVQAGTIVLGALFVMAGFIRIMSDIARPVLLPVIILCLAIFSWCFWASRRGKAGDWPAIVLLVTWSVVISGVSFSNGGFSAPTIILLPLVPLMGTLTIGPRAGLVALAAMSAFLTCLLALKGSGYEFTMGPMAKADHDLLRGLNLLASVVLVGGTAWYYAHQTERLSATIYQHATHDHLTGLLNRRAIDDYLNAELARSSRNGGWISFILADVDNFKAFNDSHGHQAGDSCLQEVAARIGAGFNRSTDAVGRWGGEEFAAILPDTDPVQAERLANLVRRGIESHSVGLGNGTSQPVTITLGVGSVRSKHPVDPTELVELADQALYKGKGEGKNRVCASIMCERGPGIHELELRRFDHRSSA